MGGGGGGSGPLIRAKALQCNSTIENKSDNRIDVPLFYCSLLFPLDLCLDYMKRQLINIMVHILDGNSERIVHVWRTKVFFSERIFNLRLLSILTIALNRLNYKFPITHAHLLLSYQ